MVKGWDRMSTPQRRNYTRRFVAFMHKETPGFRVAFKDDPPDTMPWWHRVAHWFGRRVARDYDGRYTTVIYPVMYLPTGARESWQERPERWYPTLRHEFVHLKDFQRFFLWMSFSYAAVLPAVWTMRAFWELRGYTQNMIFQEESGGKVSDELIERLVGVFSGRDYAFMMWPPSRARRHLERLRQEVDAGHLSGPYPYGPLDHTPPTFEDALDDEPALA